MSFRTQDGHVPVPPHLRPDDTWTGRMQKALNKLRRKEPQFHQLPPAIDRTHTLRWKIQLLLEYLKHRAEGRGQRDWGAYGHEARTDE